MAASDRIFIRVNPSTNQYNASSSYVSLTNLYTKNGFSFPRRSNGLANLKHPVFYKMDTDIKAFRQVYSSNTSYFINSETGIDGSTSFGIDFSAVGDTLADAIKPTLSNRLYLKGVNYNLMNPYMVAVLDALSTGMSVPTSGTGISDGTYVLNRFGGTTTTSLPNAGVICIQGAGGGSGGTNNSGADAAGAGGGGGGFAMIYYRVKNTESEIKMTTYWGGAGSAGSAGSGDGGGGGSSYVEFVSPGGTCRVTCGGGGGGQTGDRSYNRGGGGGSVSFSGGTSTISTISGGSGGKEGSGPGEGSNSTGKPFYNDSYLYVYLICAVAGSGGGAGDDTTGSAMGQAGAGTKSTSGSMPRGYSSNTTKTLSVGGKSGGSKGASVTDAVAGGGGASALYKGANGGAKASSSSTANSGSLGSGAGGAGCGKNANWAGAKGGNGGVYILNQY